MAKGFDPKWSLVALLYRFEQATSDDKTPCEKTEGFALMYNGAAISTLSPYFPGGALRLADQASPSKYAISDQTPSVFFGADLLIETQIAPTSWGLGGRRVIAHSSHVVIYLDPANFSLRLGINLSGSGWVDVGFAIPDPEAFITEKHDLRIKSSSSILSIELDGSEVVSESHGVTSFATAAQQFRFGNAYDTAPDQVFLGYIGQFRMTIGDLRPEDSGKPIERFAALGALDPYREFVVAHTHFDGQNDATEVDDTRGANWIFSGPAKLKESSRRFGVSALHVDNGTVHCDGFDFSNRNWCVELWSRRANNNGTPYYIASIMDEAGIDHAVSIGGPYFGPLTLRVAGVDVATGSSSVYAPISDWWHCAIVRDGDALAVFAAGSRALLYDLGASNIASNGRLVLGKGGSVAPLGDSPDWFDEARITIGHSRYNVNSLSITPPPERFNEYGPHSMRGTVKRMVSGSAVISPGSLVAAFDRATLRLVSRDVSAADGSFELPSAHGDEHFVLAFDDDMNLVGYDKIKPAIFS